MGNLVKVSNTFISSTKDGKPPMDINVKKPPTYAIHPALPWCKNHPKLELGHKTMTQDELKIVTWAQPTKPTQDFDFLRYKHFWEPF
jgi:hypothetical protein